MPTSDKTTVPNKETSNPIAKDDQIEILVYQAAVESQAALSTARRLIEIFNNLLRNVRDPGERPRLSAHFGRCVTSNGLLWRIGSSKSRGISAGQAAQECYDSMPYVTDINNPDGERKRRIMGCKDVTEKIDEMETETYKWFTDLSGDWQNFLGYWPPSSEVDEMRALYGHCIAKFLAFWQAIRNANQEVRNWLARALDDFEGPYELMKDEMYNAAFACARSAKYLALYGDSVIDPNRS